MAVPGYAFDERGGVHLAIIGATEGFCFVSGIRNASGTWEREWHCEQGADLGCVGHDRSQKGIRVSNKVDF